MMKVFWKLPIIYFVWKTKERKIEKKPWTTVSACKKICLLDGTQCIILACVMQGI